MPTFTVSMPPSTNELYANVPKVGRVKTAKYKAWTRGEMMALVAQRARPVPWPVSIVISAPYNTRRDCDNLLKPCCDLLVNAGIIPDDSARYVEKCTVGWTKEARGVDGVQITVEPITQ